MAGPVALVLGGAMRPQGRLAAQLGGDALQLADALAEGGEGLLDAGRVVPLRRARQLVGLRQVAHPLPAVCPQTTTEHHLATVRRRTALCQGGERDRDHAFWIPDRSVRSAGFFISSRACSAFRGRAAALLERLRLSHLVERLPSAASNSSRSSAVARPVEPRAQLLGGIRCALPAPGGAATARATPGRARRRSRQVPSHAADANV